MTPLEALRDQLKALHGRDLHRKRRTMDGQCTPRTEVERRPMLAFCSNDYLGLAAEPAIIRALQEGAERYGAGSGASHLISGHFRVHEQLEERLAAWASAHIPNAGSLYFSTGYMANVGLIAAMTALDPDTEVFSEALNHASLIDGMRLARTKAVVYEHLDVAELERLLAASKAKVKLVVTDSVFSMDGNLAPLPQLLAACEKHGAWLVVDDAHGFGVLGDRGHGVLEHFSLNSSHIIYMGTLGKAAGVAGAFVAADASVIDWLVQRARSYVYSTASPPAIAHALLTSLDIIEGPEGERRRARLRSLVDALAGHLKLVRWKQMPSSTAIQPVLIGPNDEAIQAARELDAVGYWVPAIRPPTVPPGTARLRITLSATHQESDVVNLAHAVNAIESKVCHP